MALYNTRARTNKRISPQQFFEKLIVGLRSSLIKATKFGTLFYV